MSDKVAHLGFIQGVITRMGANSFMIKGWSITLVAAIFALAAKDSNVNLVLLAFFPIVMFWLLDVFFLHQEKLFRKLYEKVADGTISSDLFTMDTRTIKHLAPSKCCIFFSRTIFPFYAIIIILVVIAKTMLLT